jgi:multiple sugar transport system permease protein
VRRRQSTVPRGQDLLQRGLPSDAPINDRVGDVVIESREPSTVWVITAGRNGLELIAALVSQNVWRRHALRFGSALAVIMMGIPLCSS